MSRVRGKDTAPERTVRRIAHGLGYRFRLHDKKLPGSPDIVFRWLRKIVFVHGCFWHKHNCRHGRNTPKTNTAFWRAKRERNSERDHQVRRSLRRKGWVVLVIWECQCRDVVKLTDLVAKFLGGHEAGSSRRRAGIILEANISEPRPRGKHRARTTALIASAMDGGPRTGRVDHYSDCL